MRMKKGGDNLNVLYNFICICYILKYNIITECILKAICIFMSQNNFPIYKKSENHATAAIFFTTIRTTTMFFMMIVMVIIIMIVIIVVMINITFLTMPILISHQWCCNLISSWSINRGTIICWLQEKFFSALDLIELQLCFKLLFQVLTLIVDLSFHMIIIIIIIK